MIEERMIDAWVLLASTIKENRFLDDFSFNEMMVLGIVYKHKNISFTNLCKETAMLKSLLNRTLTSLIDKNILEMKAFEGDKRKKIISFKDDKYDVYLKEHEKLVKVMTSIKNKIGLKKTEQLVESLNTLGNVIKEGDYND